MNSSESQGGIQPRKVWEPLVCAILALGLYMYNSASVTRLRAHQLAVGSSLQKSEHQETAGRSHVWVWSSVRDLRTVKISRDPSENTEIRDYLIIKKNKKQTKWTIKDRVRTKQEKTGDLLNMLTQRVCRSKVKNNNIRNEWRKLWRNFLLQQAEKKYGKWPGVVSVVEFNGLAPAIATCRQFPAIKEWPKTTFTLS